MNTNAKNSLRVLSIGTLYPPYAVGGYEQVWRDTVERLRDMGCEVLVLASDWKGEHNGQEEDPNVRRELQLYVDELLDTGRERWSSVLARERQNDALLRGAIADLKPDVAFVGPMGGLPLGTLARLELAGVPRLCFVGDTWPSYGPKTDPWQVSLRRGRARMVSAPRRYDLPPEFRLGTVEGWVSTSELARRRAIEAGVPAERIEAIPPGPDTQRFRSGDADTAGGDLLYAGRVIEDKGVEHAVAALAHLPRHRLLVAGSADPRYANKLEHLASELGVSPRLQLLGEQRDRLPELYREAGTVLFTSVWEEPWGLVPLEAMASGTPVVASSVGGASEYLRDGMNCLEVPPADPAAIGAAVRRLDSDPVLREELRRGGLVTAEEHAYGAALERTAAAVAELAKKPSARTGR